MSRRPALGTALWLVLSLAAPLLALDVRVEALRQSSISGSLLVVESARREADDQRLSPELAYLRADLLERSGHPREAAAGFARALTSSEELAPYARYRLAKLELQLDHPETAAGLLVRVLVDAPTPFLRANASFLLRESLDRGGDCRLLDDIPHSVGPRGAKRRLDVARADCDVGRDRAPAAIERLVSLLEDDTGDEAGREASERLHLLVSDEALDRPTRWLIAQGLFQHRAFDRALTHLEPLADATTGPIGKGAAYELHYLLGRSHFWSERYSKAASVYEALADRAEAATDRAKARYQQGRSLELAGTVSEARAAYVQAANVKPRSSWTAAALLAELRLRWIGNDAQGAQELLDVLFANRGWHSYGVRGALFMASSDLVAGRADRAGGWLRQAAQTGDAFVPEIDYWLGRYEVARDRPEAAVERLRAVVRSAPGHPLAVSAQDWLERPELATAVARRHAALTGSSRLEDRIGAWILASEDERDGAARGVFELAARHSRLGPIIRLGPVDPVEWPLWSQQPWSLDERLVSLGQWADVDRSVVLKLFPSSDPNLRFTAARQLDRSGRVQDGLYLAESLFRTIDEAIPPRFLPTPFREQVYPFAHRREVLDAAARHGADPSLLLAIVREESRFDPQALSPAGARGLTQFVIATAERIATAIGRSPIRPEELFEPATAIELGAAYLAEIAESVGSDPIEIAAAYNAGEPQARQWRAYCVGDDPAEIYTKISFQETRAYVARVATSRWNYRALYESLGSPEAPASTSRTRSGSSRSGWSK